VSTRRFEQIRSGAIDLSTAYREPEDQRIFVVVADYASEPTNQVDSRQPEELPSEWFPLSDSALRIPTDTRPELSAEALAVESLERARSVIAFELTPPNSLRTEYPLRSLSKVCRSLQDVIDAFAQEAAGRPTSRGAIPEPILKESEATFIESRAASFAIVIAPTSEPRLFETSLFADATDRLAELMRSGADDVALSALVTGYGPRAVTKYRTLLEALFDDGTGGTLWIARPGHSVISSTLSVTEVAASLELLRTSSTEVHEVLLDRASIVAVHLRRGTFELFDHALGKRYSGTMDPVARIEITGLPTGDQHFYRARVLAEEQYSEASDETYTEFRLVSIGVRAGD
jgi:hypothetical protein